MRRVLLRADGNSKIGTGHLHRIFALAQMLESSFECVVIIQSPSEDVLKLFEEKFRVIELKASSKTSSEFYGELTPFVTANDIVVLDGYHFDTDYQRHVKEKCYKLVSIDDIHQYHFLADLVINHSGGINPVFYFTESYTKLALGPKYCLVKKEFLETEKRKVFSYPPSVLINCGGADPSNHTKIILEKINACSDQFDMIHVILGAANMFRSEIEKIVEDWHLSKVKIHFGISSCQMKNLMTECSVAVLSPSTVLFEYCSIGGLVFLLQIAENQKDVFHYFMSNKLAFDFELVQDILKDEISVNHHTKQSLLNQDNVFDHQSGQRMLDLFLNL